MKIKLCSTAKVGKYAACSTLLFIILMILKFFTYSIPLPTPVIAGLGVLGFILGAISMIKSKDRSLLTLLSIAIGLLVIKLRYIYSRGDMYGYRHSNKNRIL